MLPAAIQDSYGITLSGTEHVVAWYRDNGTRRGRIDVLGGEARLKKRAPPAPEPRKADWRPASNPALRRIHIPIK
jgi:hypothetical protein